MSALPARERPSPGRQAEAEWAQIEAAAPRVAAVMRRYLRQLGTFLAPRSVDAADSALRQLARWMSPRPGWPRSVTSAAITSRTARYGWPPSHGAAVRRSPRRRTGSGCGPCASSPGRIIEWDWPGAPSRNPVIAWDIPEKPEPLPRFPGDRDAAKLMVAARASTEQRDRLVVELLARTGMRAGELAGLDADAVVRIGAGHWLRIPLGKLRNDRYVPLHPELVQLLAAWTADCLEHIRRHKRLVADHRGPLDRHVIGRIVRRVGRAAGVPGVHPHRLRHTLATQFQPRHAAGSNRRPARPPQDGDDPDLRPDRQPGRRRRIRRGQRQDRRPLRAATRVAC